MIKSNLAENIKKYRKKESLTQVELAEKLDISKHSVISYEKGMTFPSSDILEKMMDLFGVTPNELFFPMNIRNKEITDKEAKIRELESYRENVLNTVKDIEENASYVEYEQPVFDQEGNIVEYRNVVISSAEQARRVLMDAIDLKNLDTDLLNKMFNEKVNKEIDRLKEMK